MKPACPNKKIGHKEMIIFLQTSLCSHLLLLPSPFGEGLGVRLG